VLATISQQQQMVLDSFLSQHLAIVLEDQWIEGQGNRIGQ